MRRACTLAVPVRRRSSQHGWAAQRDPLGASDRPGSARCDSGACPDSSEGPVLTGRSSAAISGRGVTLGSSRSDLAEQQVSGAGGLGGAELRQPHAPRESCRGGSPASAGSAAAGRGGAAVDVNAWPRHGAACLGRALLEGAEQGGQRHPGPALGPSVNGLGGGPLRSTGQGSGVVAAVARAGSLAGEL